MGMWGLWGRNRVDARQGARLDQRANGGFKPPRHRQAVGGLEHRPFEGLDQPRARLDLEMAPCVTG